MLKIRLTQTGRKNAHTYKIIVKETRSKRDGDFIDQLGYYNPLSNPAQIEIDQEKLLLWQSKGAQITPAITKLMETVNAPTPTTKKPTKKATK